MVLGERQSDTAADTGPELWPFSCFLKSPCGNGWGARAAEGPLQTDLLQTQVARSPGASNCHLETRAFAPAGNYPSQFKAAKAASATRRVVLDPVDGLDALATSIIPAATQWELPRLIT